MAPGSTIGILGGGYSGRMLALAARRLGFRPHVLELDDSCTAAGVADRSVQASAHDVQAAVTFADGCDAVTLATEDIHPEVLESVAMRAPLRPAPDAVTIAHDRRREREWLRAVGLPTLPWRVAMHRAALVAAVEAIGTVCVVKPQRRTRVEVRPLWVAGVGEAAAAWTAMRGLPTIVEPAAPIVREMTVLVARTADGELAVYPPAVSMREYGELAWTVLSASAASDLAGHAQDIAREAAATLGIEGLLAVELFLLADGGLVVNEVVPAPHPTYHGTELAGTTDQFEQLVRCVTGLPLGTTTLRHSTATVALRTSRWSADAALERALRVSGVHGFFRQVREGAVGHLSAAGETVEEATLRVLLAAAEIDRRHARRASRLRRQLAAPPARRQVSTSMR